MISLNLDNLGKIKNDHGDSLSKYLRQIESKDIGFYKTIDDEDIIKSINEFAKEKKGKFTNIVILGIGGSTLGTTCLMEALKPKKSPEIHIIDNIDPFFIKQIEDKIDIKKTLFITVSKSGTTTETISLYNYFRAKTDKKSLPTNKHFVFISNTKTGLLQKISKEERIPLFPIPENVGGRFSVLTAVSLLPAKLAGIKIEKILVGAQQMRDNFLKENSKENLPFKYATVQYAANQKGKTINVLMPYSNRLTALANWYRQLLAESIGKNGKGLTPITALGATDQHSQIQLYNDGPNDKLITFLEILDHGKKIKIPNSPTPLTFNQLINIEKKATEQALTKNKRQNLTIQIEKIDEESIGELLMFFQCSIALLGEFYDINAYDQPGVELGKKLTKELINAK